MSSAPSRRELSTNPYAAEPLSIWEARLMEAGSSEQRFRAFDAVTQLAANPAIAGHALRLLDDGDPELRAAAARWLSTAIRSNLLEGELSAQAQGIFERLQQRLDDSDPDVKLEAARGLVCLAPESHNVSDVVLGLLAIAETPSTTQAALAELCGRLPHLSERLVSFLKSFSTSESAEVREAAATAFARWGARAVIAENELAAALEDEEPIVREQAAVALGHLDAVRATSLDALRQAAQDEDAGVAAAAQTAVHRQGG
jgi:HEAT repeat protein